MSKLFKVTATITFLLAEDDKQDAKHNVLRYAREHLSDALKPLENIIIEEITTKEEVPKEWLKAIPYGDAATGDAKVEDFFVS
jgi:hypothetical protein